MDPWLYLSAMKKAATELGVTFLEAVPCEFKHRVAKTDPSSDVIDKFALSYEKRILSDVLVSRPT